VGEGQVAGNQGMVRLAGFHPFKRGAVRRLVEVERAEAFGAATAARARLPTGAARAALRKALDTPKSVWHRESAGHRGKSAQDVARLAGYCDSVPQDAPPPPDRHGEEVHSFMSPSTQEVGNLENYFQNRL
jgi:hypothetical protein